MNVLKNLFGKKDITEKEFDIVNKVIKPKVLGEKGDSIEIWYEDGATKKFVEAMPFSNSVIDMFEIFKKEHKCNFKYFIITNSFEENDNWYLRGEKVWIVTLTGLIETLRATLLIKEIDVENLDKYLKERIGEHS